MKLTDEEKTLLEKHLSVLKQIADAELEGQKRQEENQRLPGPKYIDGDDNARDTFYNTLRGKGVSDAGVEQQLPPGRNDAHDLIRWREYDQNKSAEGRAGAKEQRRYQTDSSKPKESSGGQNFLNNLGKTLRRLFQVMAGVPKEKRW